MTTRAGIRSTRFVVRRQCIAAVVAVAISGGSAERTSGSDEPQPRQYRTEEHWIVDEIVRDIAGIISFAATNGGDAVPDVAVEFAEGDPTKLTVVAQSAGRRVAHTFERKHHIWSAETYAPVATALLEAWAPNIGRDASPPDESLLNALASAELATLVRASRRLSESLGTRPLDAELHESAALVAGCFALREAAGMFRDQRPALSRLTTHLALARALRPREGKCGNLARVLALTLAVRQKEALAALETAVPQSDSWAHALRLRTTGDWRLLREPQKATRLEQLELFRALKRAGASTKAGQLLESLKAPATAEWSRFARERDLSVQEGHVFVADSVGLELQSLADAHEAFYGSSVDEAEMPRLLGWAAERSVTRVAAGEAKIEVLSWGHIAAFHQRHICHASLKSNRFLRNDLAAKATAAEFDKEVAPFVSELTLFPIVKQSLATRGTGKGETLPDAEALTRSHPQLLTAAAWNSIPAAQRTASIWFRPELPFGTYYDLWPRYTTFAEKSLLQKGKEFWSEAAAIAPFDLPVSRVAMAARFGANPSAEQIAESFAATKPFVVDIMTEIAGKLSDDVPAYRKMMEEAAAIEPDYLVDLGNQLASKGLAREAADAYERAFTQSTDRVYVANHSRWLVDFYLDHGRRDEAEKIARAAAETNSSRGLATLARLLERTGRIKEAEEYFRRVKDRYDEPAELDAFYVRNQERHAEYRRRAEERIAALFPAGIEQVRPQLLVDAPADGVVIESANDLMRAAGLKPGDVIVAVDGVRVRSLEQFAFARDRRLDSTITFTIWTGDGYVDRAINVPGRRLNFRMRTLERR